MTLRIPTLKLVLSRRSLELNTGIQWLIIATIIIAWLSWPPPDPTPPLPAAARTNRDGFLALLYSGASREEGGRAISTGRLREHLEAMKGAGYQPITLEEAKSFMLARTPLPEKAVLLNFEDGKRETAREAEKILLEWRAPATLFLRLDAMERADPRYPTWHDVRVLARTGRWSFGSKGIHCLDLVPVKAGGTEQAYFLNARAWKAEEGRLETGAEWRERAAGEIRSSAEAIRGLYPDWIPVVFAYPFANAGQAMPDGGAELRRIVAETYPLSFSENRYAFNHWGRPHDRLTWLPVDPRWTGKELVSWLDAQWSRRSMFAPSSEKELVSRRGRFTVQSSRLILEPASGRGAEAWIAGSESWRGVQGEAILETRRGVQSWIFLRGAPGGDFLRIGWTGSRIEVQAKNAAGVQSIAEGSVPEGQGRTGIAFDLSEQRIRFQVAGGKAPQRSYPLPRQREAGMAGLGIWFAEGEPGPVVFENLRLEPRTSRGALISCISEIRDRAPEPLDVVAPRWFEIVACGDGLRLKGAPDPALSSLAAYRGAALWPVIALHSGLLPARSPGTVARLIEQATRGPGIGGVLLDLRQDEAAGEPLEPDELSDIIQLTSNPLGILTNRPLKEFVEGHSLQGLARVAASGEKFSAGAAPRERLLLLQDVGKE